MSLYETDFLSKMGVLLKEAFKFKKYKAMSPALAVFTGILMLPLVLASFAVTATLAVLCFAFTVLSSPLKYLHALVHEEGQTVRHLTQAIVYFISWPLVFFLYVLMSLLLLLIIPTYALLSVLLYAWSLGGFKFHLFMNKFDDISINVEGRYLALPIVFIVIGYLIVLVVPLIHGIFIFFDMYEKYLEEWFFQRYSSVYCDYISVHVVFSFLYSILGFARAPKSKAPSYYENETNT